MSGKRSRAERRRATSAFRDKSRREREAAGELIGGNAVIEIALPHLTDDVSHSVAVLQSMADVLVEQGLVYVVDDTYFCDDRQMLRDALDKHRELMVCDFCSGPEPVVNYPCNDTAISLEIAEDGTNLHGSYGQWTACAACERMIDAGDKKGLAAASARKFGDEMGVTEPGDWAVLHATIAATQEAFWANRAGEKNPL